MARKTDSFTESGLISALRAIARKQESNGGSMLLWHDAENIRRLRDACRQEVMPAVKNQTRVSQMKTHLDSKFCEVSLFELNNCNVQGPFKILHFTGQDNKMKTITISSEWKLQLTAHPGTDGERFAELFRRVWEEIPKDHRICMKMRCKHDGQPHISIQTFPLRNFPGGEPFPIACYWPHPEEFRFRSTWIDQMPDSVVDNLIAHELAHCLIIARRSDGPVKLIAGADEEEAAEVMEEWGFSDASIEIWVDENRHSFFCEECKNELIGPIGSWEQCPDCLADYLIEQGTDGVKPIRCSSAQISELIGGCR